MNGTDLYTLELKMGDTLQIQFETEKGSLYMEIKAPDGELSLVMEYDSLSLSWFRGEGETGKGEELASEEEY